MERIDAKTMNFFSFSTHKTSNQQQQHSTYTFNCHLQTTKWKIETSWKPNTKKNENKIESQTPEETDTLIYNILYIYTYWMIRKQNKTKKNNFQWLPMWSEIKNWKWTKKNINIVLQLVQFLRRVLLFLFFFTHDRIIYIFFIFLT